MIKRININSNWGFIKDSCSLAETRNKTFKPIDLPHTWNNLDGQDGGDDYHRGLCWYKKILTLEGKITDKAYIEFEAVNSVANVYLNGYHLGEHRGGYSLFRFDMTEHLRSGENELIVSADNSHMEDVYPLMADFTFYGGIYRDVNIILTENLHFDLQDYGSSGVYIKQKEISQKRALVEVTAAIRNFTEISDIDLSVSMIDMDGNVVSDGMIQVSPGNTVTASISLELINPILWDGLKNPYLYICQVIISAGDKIYDTLSIPTGLRFFEFDGNQGFLLNGKPLRLNGVSRHQDRENFGNAISKEHQEEDIALIKEVGANSIRLAHYQHNKYFYELCDRAGIVVWAEIPYITRTSGMQDYAANAINQMKELVKQNYNNASIIIWGVQNEIGIFPEEKPLDEIVRTMNSVVKEIDTSRVTAQAQVMMIKEDDPANWETDIIAFNQYHGWYIGETEGYDKFINTFRKANPNKCMGYSEYGAEGILKWHSDDPKVKDYTEEYHSKFHEEVMSIFSKYNFIWGTYVWNMFDFGSDMRDEGGIKGRNNKGLVTFDRKLKKDAFFFYKSLWNPEPMIHICSKRFVERHKKIIIIKVYSNQDTVALYRNGKLIETKSSNSTIFNFTVKLKHGQNNFTAVSGALEDSASFIKVKRQNNNYILPESERKKGFNFDSLGPDENVANWFSKETETGELEFPDGFFSIKDSIKDIMSDPKGESLMNEYLKPLVEHAMFPMIKKQSLETIFTFKPDAVPDALRYKINSELNKIQKQKGK